MGLGTAWSGRLACTEDISSVRIRIAPPRLNIGSIVHRLEYGTVTAVRGVRFPLEPPKMFATVAQSVEHLTCNEDVAGSIPVGGSNF